MISGTDMAALLHAIASGHTERALNLIVTVDGIEEDLRGTLHAAISENESASARARAVGDALHDTLLDAESDQALVNESYRLAFYLGEQWAELANNPLFAYFTADRAGHVLDKWVHYFPIYARHLERFRGRPVRVLEIGVYRGGGLDMLSRYLGPDAQLVGLDIDDAAVAAVAGRYPVILGDQADPDVLNNLNDEFGPFDIVLDDGGHTMQQQITTVETMFPLLNDGGIVLVEDTHTSFWSSYGGGRNSPGSFVEWSKHRVDDMHWRHDPHIDRTSVWATHLAALHCYDSVVVFDKRRRFAPFNEIAGSASFVWAGRYNEVLGSELLATRDQALRDRDAARDELTAMRTQVAPEREELRVTRSELARTRARLGELDGKLADTEGALTSTRNELLESWEQIRATRKTLSWRVTKPLRAVRRLMLR